MAPVPRRARPAGTGPRADDGPPDQAGPDESVPDDASPAGLPPVDAGPRRAGRRNARTCIVTRVADPPEGLVRFVLAPDGTVVPDVANELPGRGAHVTARVGLVRRAAGRHLFARAFRREARAPDDLAERTAALLRARAVNMLPVLRKAGDLIAGASKVEERVRAGDAALVLHAAEAAPDGVRRLDQARRVAGRELGVDIGAEAMFTADELAVAFGDANVVHVAVRAGAGGEAFLARLRRYRDFLGDPDGPPGDPVGGRHGPSD